MGPIPQRLLQILTSVMRKEGAEALLEAGVELPDENIAIYKEEMGHLFCHTEPNMSDGKKLRFLMSGVKHGLLDGIIRNPPNALAAFW